MELRHILLCELSFPLSRIWRQLPKWIVTILIYNTEFIDFISFWHIVESSSRCLCRATQAHKLWGQSSNVFGSSGLTEPSSARTCVWWTTGSLSYKARLVPEAHVWFQQWERQRDSGHGLHLGSIFLQSFDKATGNCFPPRDDFFVTVTTETFLPSQIGSRRYRSFTRRLWENLCFPREDYFLKVC